jgi:hypothetical protein
VNRDGWVLRIRRRRHPDDHFANDDADEEEVTEETDVPSEQADEIEVEEQGRPTAPSGESEAAEASTGAVRGEDDPGRPGSAVLLDIESPAELDAARLAREFVLETYDKPHAWALGRDGVNVGRAEKKTFFLQSRYSISKQPARRRSTRSSTVMSL